MEMKNYTTAKKYFKLVIKSHDIEKQFNNEIIEMLLRFNGEQKIEYLVIKKCGQFKNKLLFYKTENGDENRCIMI
jgi:hypothetical protein